jgi:hypothetical protein
LEQGPAEEKLVVPETPPEGPDDLEAAKRESSAITELKLNNYRRGDRLNTHVHKATVCFVWMFFFAMTAMGIVWLWHLIMQLDKLQTSLFSAIGSSALTDRAKKLSKGSQD